MKRLIKILESKLKDCKLKDEVDNTLTVVRNNTSINISNIDGLIGIINHDLYRQFDSEEYYINSLVDLIKQELNKVQHSWSYYPNDHNTNTCISTNIHSNNKLLLV